jgi:hypothetical protein
MDRTRPCRPLRKKNSGTRAALILDPIARIFLAVILAGAVAAAEPERVAIPGTNVRIAPPADFVLSKRFPGLEQRPTQSVLTIAEWPASFERTVAAFSDANALRRSDMEVLERRTVSVGGRQGLLLNLRYTPLGRSLRKWTLVLGEGRKSMMASATCPADIAPALFDGLRASLLTVQWAPEKPVPPEDPWLFTLAAPPAARVVGKSPTTLALQVADSSSSPQAVATFMISSSYSMLDAEPSERYAKARLGQTAQTADLRFERVAPVEIDGLKGFELTATGRSAARQPVVLYEAILFDDEGYFVMQSQTSPKQADKFLPTFRTLARTFRRKHP